MITVIGLGVEKGDLSRRGEEMILSAAKAGTITEMTRRASKIQATMRVMGFFMGTPFLIIFPLQDVRYRRR